MDAKTAIAILLDHNKWRRHEAEYAAIDTKQKYRPHEVGEAIDFAVEFIGSALEE